MDLNEIYARNQKDRKEELEIGESDHRCRQDAADLPATPSFASPKCHPLMRKDGAGHSVSVADLDSARDLRELIMSMRHPIVPLDGAHAGAPVSTFASMTVEALDGAKPVASRPQLDCLVLVSSILARLQNLHHVLPEFVDVELGPALRLIGRTTGGSQRRWLATAFDVCANTAFLSRFLPARRIPIFKGTEHLAGGRIRVWLDPWLIEEIEEERMLRIAPDVFQLTPIERRLFSLARAGLGTRDGDVVTMRFWDIFDRSGSCDEPRKFRAALKRAVSRDRAPGFHFSLSGTGPHMVVHAVPRRADERLSEHEGSTISLGLSELLREEEPTEPAAIALADLLGQSELPALAPSLFESDRD